MQLKHAKALDLKKEILNAIGSHLDVTRYKIFFFGSRVNGKGSDHSDIDVGIEGLEAIPLKTMGAIQESIDSISTLYKIEIVDFSQVSSDFAEVAKSHIEMIN